MLALLDDIAYYGGASSALACLGIQGTGSGSRAYYSGAGQAWTKSAVNFRTGINTERLNYAVIAGSAYILNSSGQLHTTQNFRTFSAVAITSITDNNNEVIWPSGAHLRYDGTRLICVGNAFPGSNKVLNLWVSTNGGLTWTLGVNLGSSTVFTANDFLAGNSYYVVPITQSGSGNNGYAYFLGSNLAGFTYKTTSGSTPGKGVFAAALGKFFMVDKGTERVLEVAESSIGSITARSLASLSLAPVDIAYSSSLGRLVAAGDSGTAIKIAYSADGASWTAASVPVIPDSSGFGSYMNLVTTDQGGFVLAYAAEDGSPNAILYSADGITWSAASISDASAMAYNIVPVNNPFG